MRFQNAACLFVSVLYATLEIIHCSVLNESDKEQATEHFNERQEMRKLWGGFKYLPSLEEASLSMTFAEIRTPSPTAVPLTKQPSGIPTTHPSESPTSKPTNTPSSTPTRIPSKPPTTAPTALPSELPTPLPSLALSIEPSGPPTSTPSSQPSAKPSAFPTGSPTSKPSSQPTSIPTGWPSKIPTSAPSILPTSSPSVPPSLGPSWLPSSKPSEGPSILPSVFPSKSPSVSPSQVPSILPSAIPSQPPSKEPSAIPSFPPTRMPSKSPTFEPTAWPTHRPSKNPTMSPAAVRTSPPSLEPTRRPSSPPTAPPSETASTVILQPSPRPTIFPTFLPTIKPTSDPSPLPSDRPTKNPTTTPTCAPSGKPSENPTSRPSEFPMVLPSSYPSIAPSETPSSVPSRNPSELPSTLPSSSPSDFPSIKPTVKEPTQAPFSSEQPSLAAAKLKPIGLGSGALLPSPAPSQQPSRNPTIDPSVTPSLTPTSIPSHGLCMVQVELECFLRDGSSCEDLLPAQGGCENNVAQNLTFSYQPSDCANNHTRQPSLSCTDFLPANNDLVQMSINCRDAATNLSLTVMPKEVSAGNDFTISDSDGEGPLREVLCELTSESRVVQHVSFIASSLHLKDKFGSFQLEGCGDNVCSHPVTISYQLSNTGVSPMSVTRVERAMDSTTTLLDDFVHRKPLDPGETAKVIETLNVDTCLPVQQLISAAAEAEPPAGPSCHGAGTVEFDSTPDCNGKVELKCIVDSDGSSCSDIVGQDPQCFCEGCTQRLMFRYTGDRCNGTAAGSNYCRDVGTGDMLAGKVTIQSHAGTLFDDIVFSTGEIRVFVDGGCIGEVLTVTITNPISKALEQQSIWQTSCEADSQLKVRDRVGALQFSGYTCSSGEVRNCFVGVTHTVLVKNTGQVNFSLMELDFHVNERKQTLLSQSGPELRPSEELAASIADNIDVCRTNTHYASAEMLGSTEQTQVPCASKDSLTVQIEERTSMPTQTPTTGPSNLPSSTPSQAPSLDPTPVPSEYPTKMPTSSPVAAIQTISPTGTCPIETSVNCTLDNGNPCSTPFPAVVPCTGRPTQIGMLLRGGFCNQSDHIQPDKFFCTDFENGPPLPRSGDLVYIVVTDAKEKGRTFFDGEVYEGDVFVLEDEGLELEADSIVTIFSDSNQNDMLQQFTFHSSCSQNLRLKDTFGATQLVQWFNEEQGNVTCFASVQMDLSLSVPLTVDSDERINVDQLHVTTNFLSESSLDLTNQIPNGYLSKESSAVIRLNATFDLTERREYSITSAIRGISGTGEICMGFDRNAFIAGNPTPPSLPTDVPTSSPSVSFQPTADPETTPCEISVSILCGAEAEGRGQAPVECQGLMSPHGLRCQAASPTELTFLFTGLSCEKSKPGSDFSCKDSGKGIQPDDDTVTIVVTDEKARTVYFEGVVRRGQTFKLGPTSKDIYIRILDGKGKVLQELEMSTDCKSDKTDLRVSSHYGALQLEGFSNSVQGEQRAIHNLRYQFLVENTSLLPATIVWANRTSLLLGDQTLVAPPGWQLPAGDTLTLEYPFQLNLVSAAGTSFGSHYTVSGVGTRSGRPCRASAEHHFIVSRPPLDLQSSSSSK